MDPTEPAEEIEQEVDASEIPAAEAVVEAPPAPPPKPAPPIPSQRVLLQVIEAILFIGNESLTADFFCRSFPAVAIRDFERCIRILSERYRRQHRPYTIERSQGGYQVVLDSRHRAELQARARPDKGVKLSPQAINVLSVVAYRQPISRAQIERLTGADPGALLRQLVRRRLIELQGGAQSEYVTTPRFLELFGIDSLEELPAIDNLEL